MQAETAIALLSISFGLWAGVVAWGLKLIIGRIDGIGLDMKSHGDKFNAYIVQTETRLAVLERENNINGKKPRGNS